MDTRILAVFLTLFVISCGGGVAQVPIAVADGKVAPIQPAKPDPTVTAPLVGNPIAPVQEFDFGEDPDLNSHSESQ